MDLSQEQKRIKIAEACGWSKVDGDNGLRPDGIFTVLPDYFNNLNAMHEAEEIMTDEHFADYALKVCGSVNSRPLSATAAERAEIFGLILNLWDDTK